MAVKVLVLGAHPDDAEVFAGGLLSLHAERGAILRIISVTDGRNGHQSMSDGELIQRRRREAAEAGKTIGADYRTWDFPDGSLQPTIEVREKIIREIREFQPDLVLSHRIFDYHPDHRAVGQAVQDASYMVTVPKVVPQVPALARDPIVAMMADTFTRPCTLRPDAVVDVSGRLDAIATMLSRHESQVFEWLPYNQGILDKVPADPQGRLEWLKSWLMGFAAGRLPLFWKAEWGAVPKMIEAYEISEYAGRLSPADFDRLFPTARRGI
ncbi:MAG: PIG-L family deacetylase [Pirellulales bacterium]